MAAVLPPFGGTPGVWNSGLLPSPTPPPVGYRLIPGSIWWPLTHWSWRQYLAALTSTPPYPAPPFLGPPKPAGTPSGIYFTDQDSLEGILSAGDFALRLNLPSSTQLDCQKYGCAIVAFQTAPHVIAPAGSTITYSVTPQGAREWVTTGNIALNTSMKVKYIDRAPGGGPRYFDLPL